MDYKKKFSAHEQEVTKKFLRSRELFIKFLADAIGYKVSSADKIDYIHSAFLGEKLHQIKIDKGDSINYKPLCYLSDKIKTKKIATENIPSIAVFLQSLFLEWLINKKIIKQKTQQELVEEDNNKNLKNDIKRYYENLIVLPIGAEQQLIEPLLKE